MSSHLWCSGPVSVRKTDIEYSVQKKGRLSILDMKFIKQKFYFYVISIECINSVSNDCGFFFSSKQLNKLFKSIFLDNFHVLLCVFFWTVLWGGCYCSCF